MESVEITEQHRDAKKTDIEDFAYSPMPVFLFLQPAFLQDAPFHVAPVMIGNAPIGSFSYAAISTILPSGVIGAKFG